MNAPRKPRIAFMGEFSAGKSTLTNLLLGGRPLPEKVTATRLSPVWMSYGRDAPYRIKMDGAQEEISLSRLDGIPLEDTRVIRIFFEADILGICDLIDFPGISDPNMSSEVWQRVLEEVDAIIWCTHATQAWRQSEAAVWEGIPQAVRDRSILLITRFDKLTSVRDEQRVLARLEHETAGQFGGMFPISLTDALAAGDNEEEFAASGGAAFLVHLLNQIKLLSETACQTERTLYQNAMGLVLYDDAPAVAAAVAAQPEAEPMPEPEVAAPSAPLSVAPEPEPQPESEPELDVDLIAALTAPASPELTELGTGLATYAARRSGEGRHHADNRHASGRCTCCQCASHFRQRPEIRLPIIRAYLRSGFSWRALCPIQIAVNGQSGFGYGSTGSG